MKRTLILSVLFSAVIGAVAFAIPNINPYFEIENVGIVAAPTLAAGAIVEGNISQTWDMSFGFEYTDANILELGNPVGLGFKANVGFDEVAVVNETGSIEYGASLSFTQDARYKTNAYPVHIKLKERTTGFLALGYVGPLSMWGGIDFPWDGTVWLEFIPTFGFRVDFNINL